MQSRVPETGSPAISDILKIAALVVLGWILAVWVSALVYLAASYPAAERYVPHRAPSGILRALGRELWLAMWTQPLLPLFQYGVGGRFGTGGGEVPVVLGLTGVSLVAYVVSVRRGANRRVRGLLGR